MATLRYHFQALLSGINPSADRISLASTLPGDVRLWLKDHDFPTVDPHSRLSGSYARSTAILDINDVDCLFFVPVDQLDRTPNALLRELRTALDGYPGAYVETVAQRRSVRLEFSDYGLHLDIVPVVAPDGYSEPLLIPDRLAKVWIDTDPLGYGARLSALNKDNGGKVIPLIKLFKAWRNVQMVSRKPKSYVMEVMVLRAVEGGHIELVGEGMAANFAALVYYLEGKYANLMDTGSEAPRIFDPQTGKCITWHWDRAHFETFMRRIRETASRVERALKADDDEAPEIWARIFGELWPTDSEVKTEARLAGAAVSPGTTAVFSAGGVTAGWTGPSVVSRPTKYHGGTRR